MINSILTRRWWLWSLSIIRCKFEILTYLLINHMLHLFASFFFIMDFAENYYQTIQNKQNHKRKYKFSDSGSLIHTFKGFVVLRICLLYYFHIFCVVFIKNVIFLFLDILWSFLDEIYCSTSCWFMFDSAANCFEQNIWVFVITTESLSVDAYWWVENGADFTLNIVVTVQEAY